MSDDDPRHGTPAGYLAHRRTGQTPCRDCTHAHSVAGKRRKLHALAGHAHRTPLGTDAHRVLDVHTNAQLIAATGLSTGTIQRLRKGGPDGGTLASTRHRILTQRPAYSPLGLRRRLQALAWLGWTSPALADALDVATTTIQAWQWGQCQWVRGSDLGERVAAFYAATEHTPLTRSTATQTARTRAARHRWHPPAAWDDIDLDHEPATGAGRRDILAEYRHLTSLGESEEQALAELGISASGLNQARRRARKVVA